MYGFSEIIIYRKKSEPKLAIMFQSNTNQGNDIPVKRVTSEVQNLVMLSIAENHKVGEKKYPDYFRLKYGVGFSNEKFQELSKEGYIKPSTVLETLPHLKATELKAIAFQINLKTSGKKDEICSRIAENVPASDLANADVERYWVLAA